MHQIKYEFKSVAKSNIILIFQYIGGALVPLLILPAILKNIGSDKFADYAIALSLGGIISAIINYSFQLTGPQEIANNPCGEHESKILKSITSTKTLIGLFLLAVSIPVILFIGIDGRLMPKTLEAYWLIALLLLSSVINSNWYLMAKEKFALSALISLVSIAFTVVFGLIFLYQGEGVANNYALVCFFSISPFISASLTYLAARKIAGINAINTSKKINELKKDVVKLLKSGLPIFLSQSVALIYGISGSLFISYHSTKEQVSLYLLNEKIGNAIIGALLLTLTASYPRLLDLYKKNNKKFLSLYRLAAAIYFLGAASAFVIYITNSSIINQLIFGELNPGGMPFAQLTFVLVALSGPYTTALLAIKDKAEYIVYFNVVTLLSVLALSSFLIDIYGGAGWILSLIFGHIPQFTFLILALCQRKL